MESDPRVQPGLHDTVVIGGRSHPDLLRRICMLLDVQPAPVSIKDFSNGETSLTIKETVRDKNVFIVQTSCGNVNDQLMELLIALHTLKIASAKSVTAVIPLFPYSRQSDAATVHKHSKRGSVADISPAKSEGIRRAFKFGEEVRSDQNPGNRRIGESGPGSNSTCCSNPGETCKNSKDCKSACGPNSQPTNCSAPSTPSRGNSQPTNSGALLPRARFAPPPSLKPLNAAYLLNPEHNHGHRSWVATSGSIVASLVAAAGADHVITMDLHDPQFQGFFDVPFDNLLFRPLLIEYIKTVLPTYHSCVIVSPDAGGAKRATSVADRLHTRFALIHQDRRNSATILVGDVSDRVAILIDDLVDTGATLMRAAQLLKDHGALHVYAVCTHGVFSGDTVYKVRDSAIDCIVTTNSVPQDAHKAVLGDKLDVVDVSGLFAEAIRRISNGESLSRLYNLAPGHLA